MIAWGDNAVGETNVPPNVTNVIAIAVGDVHTVAILGDGPPSITAPLLEPTLTSSSFSATAATRSGRTYRFESTDSLTPPIWTPWPLVAGDSRTNVHSDLNATNATRFYRLRQW